MSKNTGGSGGADRGFSIQLNRLADAKGLDAANPTDTDSKDDKAHIVFKFPDGKQIDAWIRVSQPVDYLKAHIIRLLTTNGEEDEEPLIVPPTVDDLELTWDEGELPDPVSLSDLGIVAGQDVAVRVSYTQDYEHRLEAALMEEKEDYGDEDEDYYEDWDEDEWEDEDGFWEEDEDSEDVSNDAEVKALGKALARNL